MVRGLFKQEFTKFVPFICWILQGRFRYIILSSLRALLPIFCYCHSSVFLHDRVLQWLQHWSFCSIVSLAWQIMQEWLVELSSPFKSSLVLSLLCLHLQCCYIHLAEQITALFQFSLRGHQHASTYIRPVLPVTPDRDLCPLKASFLRSPVPHWQSHSMFTSRTQPWCHMPPSLASLSFLALWCHPLCCSRVFPGRSRAITFPSKHLFTPLLLSICSPGSQSILPNTTKINTRSDNPIHFSIPLLHPVHPSLTCAHPFPQV